MDTGQIIFLLIGGILLMLNTIVTRKILRARYQDESRRRLHIWVVWMFPFLGIRITRFFWQKSLPKLEIVTKKDRKVDSGDFYESGKGMYGG